MEMDNLKKVVHDIINPEFTKMTSLIAEKLDPIKSIVDEVKEIKTNVNTLRNDLSAYRLIARYEMDVPESEEDSLDVLIHLA